MGDALSLQQCDQVGARDAEHVRGVLSGHLLPQDNDIWILPIGLLSQQLLGYLQRLDRDQRIPQLQLAQRHSPAGRAHPVKHAMHTLSRRTQLLRRSRHSRGHRLA